MNRSSSTSSDSRLSMDNYEVIRTVGSGSFGEVVLAKDKKSGEECAIKILEKSFLAREQKQYQVFIEKEVLQYLKFDGIIRLRGSFQDQQFLYFVLDYCEGVKHLVKSTIQFYSAQIVHILDELHSNGIIHRDLKPENLMMTRENKLRVIDFGTCGFTQAIPKDLFDRIGSVRAKFPDEINALEASDNSRSRTTTFVGTAEYVSPELLEGDHCSSSVDLWALGCIIYKMFVGSTPFVDLNDANEFKVFNRVKACKYSIPKNVPADAADLISRLLVRDPQRRLGWSDAQGESYLPDIKAHQFFNGIDWKEIMTMKAPKREVAYELSTDLEDFEDFVQQSPAMMAQQAPQGRPVLSGRVLKRVGWLTYKPRQVLLFEEPPRLVYYEPDTNIKKGEIVLSKQVEVELVDKTKFTILGVKKKYYFKELDHSANVWVEKILKVIKQRASFQL